MPTMTPQNDFGATTPISISTSTLSLGAKNILLTPTTPVSPLPRPPPPALQSDSNVQTLTFGLIGTVVALMALAVAVMQLRRMYTGRNNDGDEEHELQSNRE